MQVEMYEVAFELLGERGGPNGERQTRRTARVFQSYEHGRRLPEARPVRRFCEAWQQARARRRSRGERHLLAADPEEAPAGGDQIAGQMRCGRVRQSRIVVPDAPGACDLPRRDGYALIVSFAGIASVR